MCAEAGHVCAATTMDGDERPVCLDCLNERECAVVRVARATADARADLELDAMGEPVELGRDGAGPVRDVTPVDRSKVFWDKPGPVVEKDLLVPRMAEAAKDPARCGRGARESAKARREKVPVAVVRERERVEASMRVGKDVEVEKEDVMEEVVKMCAWPGCEKRVYGGRKYCTAKHKHRERLKSQRWKDGTPCAFAGCEKKAFNGKAYCTAGHGYKNRKAAGNEEKRAAVVDAIGRVREAAGSVEVARVPSGGLYEQAVRVDVAGEGKQEKALAVTVQVSVAELDAVWARLSAEKKVALLQPVLQAAMLQQFAG